MKTDCVLQLVVDVDSFEFGCTCSPGSQFWLYHWVRKLCGYMSHPEAIACFGVKNSHEISEKVGLKVHDVADLLFYAKGHLLSEQFGRAKVQQLSN